METEPPIPHTLLPCPFCGEQPKLRNMQYRSPPFDVICTGKIGDALCQCHLWPVNTAEEAIRIWNTRHHATPDLEGLRAALKRLVDLKAHKDAHGKDNWYVRNQKDAWNQAIAVVRQHEVDMEGAREEIHGDAENHIPHKMEGSLRQSQISVDTTLIDKMCDASRHASTHRHQMKRALDALRPYLRTTEPVSSAAADLAKRLRTVSDMIHMGEKIAWGNETALMDEAADFIEGKHHADR